MVVFALKLSRLLTLLSVKFFGFFLLIFALIRSNFDNNFLHSESVFMFNFSQFELVLKTEFSQFASVFEFVPFKFKYVILSEFYIFLPHILHWLSSLILLNFSELFEASKLTFFLRNFLLFVYQVVRTHVINVCAI